LANQLFTLNKNFSTTRRVVKSEPELFADFIKQAAKSDDQTDIQVFLPAGDKRKGEGGLRTLGYFKIGGLFSEYAFTRCPNSAVESKSKQSIPVSLQESVKEDDTFTPSSSANTESTSQGSTSIESNPLITVVTVVYNCEQFLEETILSVLNQTYDNVEYLVIDGGSTDGTLDIIKKYEHAIDYWVSEKDKGIYEAMNKGIDLASGDWVIFMNAGDEFITDDISSMVNLFDENATCNYGYTKWKGGKKSRRFNSPYLLRLPDHQTMFVKLNWIKNNKFDTQFTICADLDMKLKIHKDGGFTCLGLEVCAAQEGGVSQSHNNISQINNEMIIIHKKYFSFNFPFYILEFFWIFMRKLKKNIFNNV